MEAQAVPPLLITELVVNAKNVGGIDGYEFVEIYNNSGQAVTMSNYRILYRYPDYPTTPDLVWDITSTTTIPDKAFFIVWLKNTSNTSVAALTTANFISEYNYGGVTPSYIFNMTTARISAVTSTNMANTSDRTIILAKDDGTIICKASYTAANVTAQGDNESAPKKSIHFRYNDNDALPDRQQMINMGAANANPGRYVTTDTYDQVPKYPQAYTSGTGELVITELCPSTANVGTLDGYEFIELYNNRASAVALDNYRIDYAGTAWEISGTGVMVPPKNCVVLWVKNGENTAVTKAQFIAFYGMSIDPAYVVELSCSGMSNSAARTISVVRDADGVVISSAYYDPALGDVVEDKGIDYKLNPTNKTLPQMVKIGVAAAASPGLAKAGQGLQGWYSYAEAQTIPTHDYAFAIIPDPQYYSTTNTLNDVQFKMFHYLGSADKFGIKNLKHTMCVGDIVNHYADTDEWPRADDSFAELDAKGLSYGVCSGNHDGDTTDASMAAFHTWFGYSRFTSKPGYGGYHLNSAGKTDGMYYTVTHGTDQFIIVYAGINAGSSSALRTWVKGRFNAYTAKTGILVTHDYLDPNDGLSGDPDVINPASRGWIRSTAGTNLYNDVVSPCTNVRYVICGHQPGVAKRSITIGSRTVQEVVIDFQTAATPQTIKALGLYNGENGAHFGMGMLTFMFVDKTNNLIHFRTYSPWAEKNSWFDRFGSTVDGFDVPLSLQ